MIRAWTAGRHGGPRVPTHALSSSAARAAAFLAAVALLTMACGASGPLVPTLAPASVAPGPSGTAAPKTTPWPGNAMLGMEALGMADSQIGAATRDLSKGIATEDLALMRRAADGLAGVDSLLPNMTKIRLEPGMRSFADRYEAAIKAISAAGKALRDAIDKGDSQAIATTTQDLLDGLKLYTAVEPELAAWIEQLPEQKRMITR